MYGRKFVKRSTRKVGTRRASGTRFTRKVGMRRRRGTNRKFGPKWKNPMVNTSLYRLSYTDSAFVSTPQVGSNYVSDYVFRGNSLYDPDYTGLGVQPYGYDQLTGPAGAGLFGAYSVFASKIKVHFQPSTQLSGLKVYLVPTRTTTLGTTDPSDIRMLPWVKTICHDTTDGSQKQNISHYMSCRKIFPDINPKDDTLKTTYNNNPSVVFYWHVLFDESTQMNEIAVRFDVKITYYCRLTKIDYLNES